MPAPDAACHAWAAVDINNHGHVLVRCTSGRVGTFVWNGATFAEVPLGSASALNDRGEVVGWEPDGPYLWRSGRATRLIEQPPLNTTYVTSMRINNRGQVLLNLPMGAFLLTPLP